MPREGRSNADADAQVIAEFRANHGQVGGFESSRLLLLTTTVAGSQVDRTTPVEFFPDLERKLIVATGTDGPGDPAWYRDVVAQPRVTVEDGLYIGHAKAVVLEGKDRDRVFARIAQTDPALIQQQASTTQPMPVVALNPVDSAPTETTLGRAIKALHDAYRRELALVRSEVARSGPGVGAQLRINCLAICRGIHQHHTTEDNSVFPFALATYPAMAAIVERLRHDHQRVERLLDSLQEAIATDHSEPVEVLCEVDRLIAELEAHLDYEEAYLLPALDTVPVHRDTSDSRSGPPQHHGDD